RILHFADVDSEKFVAYAARSRGLARWMYAMEARRVSSEERRIAERANMIALVTDEEAALFRRLHQGLDGRVVTLPNGVDTEIFDPDRYPDPPFIHDGPTFMFTGAMDYPPNVEAVTWFAHSVFPSIREALPSAKFLIVGAKPTPSVRKLANRPGITV